MKKLENCILSLSTKHQLKANQIKRKYAASSPGNVILVPKQVFNIRKKCAYLHLVISLVVTECEMFCIIIIVSSVFVLVSQQHVANS